MKETMKRIKADMIVSAILCVALGVVLFVWSEETIGLICRALAVILMVLGVIQVTSYFMNRLNSVFHVAFGLIELLVGLWIFLRPESVVSLIPIVIGVILLIHGASDLKTAFETKKNGYESWWSILIMAVISMVCGIISIAFAFQVVSFVMKFIGFALIYDGLSDLWIVTRAIKAAKNAKKEEEALNVEYKEVDSEEVDSEK
ncbi:MAG: HdeD family acid-resistance protein [Roseburia sp.]